MSEAATNMRPTRTPAFEARLKKRYAAERRFKAIGLGAILFSIAVLLFLLVTMAMNGLGGFQRTELRVPVDFAAAPLTVSPDAEDERAVVQSLEQQGLRDIIEFSATEALGEEGAAEINSESWRIVAQQIAEDPSLARGQQEFWLPTSEDLATAYAGDGSAELQPLARPAARVCRCAAACVCPCHWIGAANMHA